MNASIIWILGKLLCLEKIIKEAFPWRRLLICEGQVHLSQTTKLWHWLN